MGVFTRRTVTGRVMVLGTGRIVARGAVMMRVSGIGMTLAGRVMMMRVTGP
jgi:hypothetical protein